MNVPNPPNSLGATIKNLDWVSAVHSLGATTVACIALGWFAYNTITWEREQMVPTINQNTHVMTEVRKSLDDRTRALEANTRIMERINERIKDE